MNILFISHSADLTGAPLALYKISRELHTKYGVNSKFIIRNGGILESKFSKIGKVIVLLNKPTNIFTFILFFLTKTQLGRKLIYKTIVRRKIKARDIDNVDLVINNTSTNGELLKLLQLPEQIPVITRVAELESMINKQAGKNSIKQTIKYSNIFIAVSESVKNNLINNYNINENSIHVIPSFIYPKQITEMANSVEADSLRKKFNIDKRTLVVGSSGSPGLIKGTDLFIQTVKMLHKHGIGKKYLFLWVGGNKSNKWFKQLLKLRNLNIIAIPYTENPYVYFNLFDIFILFSREDSFPNVCMENAYLGKPIICFNESGGAKELVNKGCGITLDKVDINEVIRSITLLQQNKELLYKLGNKGTEIIKAGYTQSQIPGKIHKLIQETLKNN